MTGPGRKVLTDGDIDQVTCLLVEASGVLTILVDHADAHSSSTGTALAEAIGGARSLIEAARDVLI